MEIFIDCRLRASLRQSSLQLTENFDRCIWLYENDACIFKLQSYGAQFVKFLI